MSENYKTYLPLSFFVDFLLFCYLEIESQTILDYSEVSGFTSLFIIQNLARNLDVLFLFLNDKILYHPKNTYRHKLDNKCPETGKICCIREWRHTSSDSNKFVQTENRCPVKHLTIYTFYRCVIMKKYTPYWIKHN